ncbi:MAG TPA: N-methyl-L-tryptophan oxidase [Gammaproteobacteria bacterium]|jgi:sarcosine oxidase
MKNEYTAIVLGVGGIGAGALYWLSRRVGGEVLGIEQFGLGHDRGSSQDHSRIIRYSYHRPFYVELAKRAYRCWDAVEKETGEQLVHRVGGLDLFPENGAIPAQDYTSSLDACGIGYERLEADEIRRRWPAFTIPDSVRGLFQADGGLVAAAKANAAHVRAARAAGAEVLENTAVTGVRVERGEVVVTIAGKTLRCRRLIVTAGAWSNPALRHLGLNVPITVTREQVIYFSAPDLERFAPGRHPIWIWMDEPSFYGFPVFGLPAVKVAQDVGGYETTADTRNFDPDPANLARVRGWCERYMPSALGPELLIKTCLYAMPPDREFVVDVLPEHPEVVVAIGGGHGFKFASALGQVLSELALDGRTEADLSAFAIDRPVLTMANPPRNFTI